MQVFTDENQGKVFMIMAKARLFALIFILSVPFWLGSCGDSINPNDTPVPSVPVSITINTDLPAYFYLKSPGTWIYFEGGNRGVVLVHDFDDQFYAFDRTCSYQPDLSCSKVEIDSARYFFKCGSMGADSFETCCNSRFQLNGLVNNGPARFPLRAFRVTFTGNTINISN